MTAKSYPRTEELANSVTHGVGLGISAVGAVVLVVLTALRGDSWQIFSSGVYGASLVALYTASTLYHSFRPPEIKRVLRIFDHCAIYLLIAGSYTPFALVSLRGGWGWTLFGLVWGLAVAGILFKVFFTGRLNALSTTVYVLMGWLCVVAAKPIIAMVPTGALWWLAAGGIIYTVGTVFYHNRRVPYSHAIWHLFVIGGSACHYFAISRYILIPAA